MTGAGGGTARDTAGLKANRRAGELREDRASGTDLQVEQQTLSDQSESGPVGGEQHQPLLLEEAGEHLRRGQPLFQTKKKREI